MDPSEHADWAAEARTLGRRTRLARRGCWFPMVVFGVLVLASDPFFRIRVWTVGYAPLRATTGLIAGANTGRMGELTAFWLIGAPLAYLLTVAYYWFKARRQGVATSTKGFVLAGLGLFGLLVVLSAVGLALPVGDTASPGLLPLVTFGVGFCVLAWAERSWGLGAFAVCFLALTVVVNVFTTVKLIEGHVPPAELFHGVPIEQVEPILVGGVLLIAGIATGLVILLRRRSVL